MKLMTCCWPFATEWYTARLSPAYGQLVSGAEALVSAKPRLCLRSVLELRLCFVSTGITFLDLVSTGQVVTASFLQQPFVFVRLLYLHQFSTIAAWCSRSRSLISSSVSASVAVGKAYRWRIYIIIITSLSACLNWLISHKLRDQTVSNFHFCW